MVLDAHVNHEMKATDCVFGDVSGEQVSMAFKRAASAAKIEDFAFRTSDTRPHYGSE